MRVLALLMLLQPLSAIAADSEKGYETEYDKPEYSKRMASVYHETRVKVLESTSPVIRPLSEYDIKTIFETRGGKRPKFNYYIYDAGLGTEELIYPVFQSGWMKNWFQLIPGIFGAVGKTDIYSITDLKEGCKVWTYYNIRKLKKSPKDMFASVKQKGFKYLVLRFEYYQKSHKDAHCGKHVANELGADLFDPFDIIKEYKDIYSLSEFPADLMPKFEIKISATKYIDTETKKRKIKRIDKRQIKPENNSLFYYKGSPVAHLDTEESNPQVDAPALEFASQTVFPANKLMREKIVLKNLLTEVEFKRFVKMLEGQPVAGYSSSDEPGGDTLKLENITSTNLYTAGVDRWKNLDRGKITTDINNYVVAGFVVKPYEKETDASFDGLRVVPQIRFVFQLKDPASGKYLEQVGIHLNFDAIDRLQDKATRDASHKLFLKDLEALANGKGSKNYDQKTIDFLTKYISGKGAENLAWSSSLTGPWVFGALSSVDNDKRILVPVRLKWHGVDLGYYSSVHDGDVFKDALKSDDPAVDKEAIVKGFEALDASHYRDPKRMDVDKIGFSAVTCSQCHHMSGKDAIFLKYNDGVDPRDKREVTPSEFIYRESNRQLKFGKSFWH
ncbi:MAG: hypothetical protein HOE90_01615 [Bacteriovoracaceae bacterium]|jgi:hypothetical protein|nr:hypothetical protein [Bacteriovoracaceae bacterium]